MAGDVRTVLCSCGHPAADYVYNREGERSCARVGCDCVDHCAVVAQQAEKKPMTIVLKIKRGQRYTLWNVEEIFVLPAITTVHHSDRGPTIIQGYVESILRKD